MTEPLDEQLQVLVTAREMMRNVAAMDVEFVNIRLRNGLTVTNDDGEITCSHPWLGDRITLEQIERLDCADGASS